MKKMIRYVCMTLAAVLLCPIMTASSQEVRRTVHVGGMPFGLTMYTGGVVVVNVDDSYDSPAKAAGLRVCAIEEGTQVNDRAEIMRLADVYIRDYAELI